MQTVCNTYWDAGKGNLMAQRTEYKKTLRRPGFRPWPRWGNLQRSRKPPPGGEGLVAPPQEPHSPLSALLASPLLPPIPKLVLTLLVTLWYWIETNAYIVKLFPPSGRGMTLSFSSATAVTIFQGEFHQRGRWIHGARKKLRFSTEIAVYLENCARHATDYCGWIFGSHRLQNYSCQFQ